MPHLRKGRQCGSGAYQVGADLDGLAEFGFSLHLVFEAQVSETGEVMGVGRTGAAYTSTGGRRGLLQLIPRGLYQALEKRLGFFRLTQLLEGESLVVGLRGAAGGDAPELVAAAPCAGLGRRYRPLPGLRGFSGVPGAFIGYAGPVSEFCFASVDAAEKADGQVRRNGGGGFEIGQRFLVAFGANFRLGALNVGFGPLPTTLRLAPSATANVWLVMVRMASSTWPVATWSASARLRASSRRATTEAFCWNNVRRFSSGVPACS